MLNIELTFNKDDKFEHRYSAVERYIKNSIKNRPRKFNLKMTLQIWKDRTVETLTRDLYDLNRLYAQTLYITIEGINFSTTFSLGIEYLKDEKVWIVRYVNYDPSGGIRSLMEK